MIGAEPPTPQAVAALTVEADPGALQRRGDAMVGGMNVAAIPSQPQEFRSNHLRQTDPQA